MLTGLVQPLHGQEIRTRGRRSRTVASAAVATAITGVKGQVVDADTKEPIAGAIIRVPGTTIGTLTRLDGTFELAGVPNAEMNITVSYLGYTTSTVPLRTNPDGTQEVGKVPLQVSGVGIEEIQILAAVSVARETPVSATSLSQQDLRKQYNAGEDVPVTLSNIPGVYASRVGGGYGDSRVRIRGFDQANLSVLVNGIPANDAQTGEVFWVSLALTEVTRTVQVQRGLGLNRFAVSSIGGTVNLVTLAPEAEPSVRLNLETNSIYGHRASATATSGLTANGWSVIANYARAWGNGYVDAAYTDFNMYFLSLAKSLSAKHTLIFNVWGITQDHGQRSSPVSDSVYEQRGIRYNPNWGFDNGKRLNANINFYYNPLQQLTHIWNINPRTQITSVGYVRLGTGGGAFLSRFSDPLERTPTTSEGLIDWAGVRAENQDPSRLVTVTASNGETVTGYDAVSIKTNFRNESITAGLLSSLQHTLDDHWTFSAGLDARYHDYNTFLNVRNLLGADFFFDTFSSRTEPARILREDDKWAFDQHARIGIFSGFGQIEYSYEKLSLFGTLNGTLTSYQRIDNFAPEGRQRSEIVNLLSYSLKGGANYNFTRQLNAFVNAGFFTRPPYWNNYFVQSNEPTQGLTNETVTSAETGVSFQSKNLILKAAGYWIRWLDRNFVFERLQLADGTERFAFVTGIQQSHLGLEAEATLEVTSRLAFSGLASVGSWFYTNNGRAQVSDPTRTSFTETEVFLDGIPVGNAPQVQLGASARFSPLPAAYILLQARHYDRLFVEFDPTRLTSRTNQGEKAVARLPAYTVLDLALGYDLRLGRHWSADFGLRFNNLADQTYYAEGTQGQGVFPGLGFTYSASVGLRWAPGPRATPTQGD